MSHHGQASNNQTSLEGSMNIVARGHASSRFLPSRPCSGLSCWCSPLPRQSRRSRRRAQVACADGDRFHRYLLPRPRLDTLGRGNGTAVVEPRCLLRRSGRQGFEADRGQLRRRPCKHGVPSISSAFGPIMSEHRLERFYFWPDPRGTTARQLSAAAGQTRSRRVARRRSFVKQSVAVQGLSALEILIYDQNTQARRHG